MRALKYIGWREGFVVFPDEYTHANIARRFRIDATDAGFFHFDVDKCHFYGSSVSMNLDSDSSRTGVYDAWQSVEESRAKFLVPANVPLPSSLLALVQQGRALCYALESMPLQFVCKDDGEDYALSSYGPWGSHWSGAEAIIWHGMIFGYCPTAHTVHDSASRTRRVDCADDSTAFMPLC